MPFDSTPQVTPALALLRAARARIEDPRNWVKHCPDRSEMEEGLHCPMTSVAYSSRDNGTIFAVVAALYETLPKPWKRIDQFSDAPETTHADILALFDRAERRLMESGA